MIYPVQALSWEPDIQLLTGSSCQFCDLRQVFSPISKAAKAQRKKGICGGHKAVRPFPFLLNLWWDGGCRGEGRDMP